jgi:hypothetical protein
MTVRAIWVDEAEEALVSRNLERYKDWFNSLNNWTGSRTYSQAGVYEFKDLLPGRYNIVFLRGCFKSLISQHVPADTEMLQISDPEDGEKNG